MPTVYGATDTPDEVNMQLLCNSVTLSLSCCTLLLLAWSGIVVFVAFLLLGVFGLVLNEERTITCGYRLAWFSLVLELILEESNRNMQ